MDENEERCCENCYYWEKSFRALASGWGYCRPDKDMTLSTHCCEGWKDKDE